MSMTHRRPTTLPPLTAEQERLFADYCREWGTPMRFLLSKHRAAVRIAERHGIEQEEIEQSAWIGVVHALHKYDPARRSKFNGRKIQFPTLAHWNAWGALSQLITVATAQCRTPQAGAWSLDAVYDDSDPHEWIGRCDPEPDFESFDDLVILHSELARLDPQQRMVIRRRYGIDCERQRLRTIAGKIGVSKERVRQIESEALHNLKRRYAGGEK